MEGPQLSCKAVREKRTLNNRQRSKEHSRRGWMGWTWGFFHGCGFRLFFSAVLRRTNTCFSNPLAKQRSSLSVNSGFLCSAIAVSLGGRLRKYVSVSRPACSLLLLARRSLIRSCSSRDLSGYSFRLNCDSYRRTEDKFGTVGTFIQTLAEDSGGP